MRRRIKWYWFFPPLLLACSGVQQQPTPSPNGGRLEDTQRSCTAGHCMICYIYTSEVECIKE